MIINTSHDFFCHLIPACCGFLLLLPFTRSHLVAKDLFAILDVVNDEFGYSAEPLFVTEREEVR